MTSVLESIASMATPDMVGQLAKTVGANPDLLTKAAGALGPTVVTSLARMAGQPVGADAIAGLMSKVGGGMAANPATALASLAGGSLGGDVVSSLLGGARRAPSPTA